MNAATVTEAPAAIPLTVRPEVQRGAEWLDERQPGWDRKVNLAELDLNSCTFCVIGQLFGDYFKIIDSELGGDDEAFGFYVDTPLDSSSFDANWAKLTEEWRDLIASRR